MAFTTEYTSTDLTNIAEAIRDLVAGERAVSLSLGDKTITFADVDLPKLEALERKVRYEIGLANGTYAVRTHAKNAGRGR